MWHFLVLLQNSASNETKYLKEAAEFEKLMPPSETSQQTESVLVVENFSSKVPDNNPFKIGKAKKICSDLRTNVTEDASVLTCVEKSETASTGDGIFSEAVTEYEQCAKGEHDVILLDQEKEDADMGDRGCLPMCSLESRERVSSRPKRVATNVKQGTGGNKQKMRKIKTSESTTDNSILNYFYFQ